MSQRVTHFEIPSDDPRNAIDFFSTVFGWSFSKFGDQDYWFAQTGSESAPGINGAIMKKRQPQQPLVNSINVTDIDHTIEAIQNAGGHIVVPKHSIPEKGWLCFFKDLDNHIHGVWQDDLTAG